MKVKCQECKGSGYITHHLWIEYWKEKEKQKNNTNDMFDLLFWSSHGYNPNQVPPEEIECINCKGKGYIEK